MANTNTPYIAKAAGPLTNPTSATLFLTPPSPIATVAATQVPKVAFATYRGYNLSGVGASSPIDLVRLNVKAAGRITFGAAGNFTPSLVLGAVGTTGNFLAASPTITLASLTPQAASGAGSGIWAMSADLTWDPNTGLISGTVSGQETVLVNGTATTTLTAATAITPQVGFAAPLPPFNQSNTVPVAIPAANGEGVLFFAASALFSVSNAANVAIQDMLQTEEL